jgi:hypothetical protein
MEVTVGINGRGGDWSQDDEAAHKYRSTLLTTKGGGCRKKEGTEGE